MSKSPSFDDVFAVMSRASVGDMTTRLAVPDDADLDDTATRFGLAVNILLDDLVERAAVAEREIVEHGRLANRLRILADASREFAAATGNLDELLDAVARRLGAVVGDLCAIRWVSDDGLWLEGAGAAYHGDPEILRTVREMMSSRQRVGEGISGRVAASGKPNIVRKIDPISYAAASDPKYRPLLERLGATSAITLPLICRGAVVGTANLLRSERADPFDDDDLQFAQSIADHAALAISNARSYAAERAARAAAESATHARVAAEDAVDRMRREHAADVRFRALVEAAPDAMVIVNDRGTIVLVNSQAEALFGHDRAELVGRPIETLVPERFADSVRRGYLASPGKRVLGADMELSGRRKDGTEIPIEISLSPLATEEGALVSSSIRGIAERRAHEHERARLAAIVNATDVAIIGKSLDGIVTSWNGGARLVFGYEADEIVGKSILTIVPPGREDEEALILEMLARGEVKHFDTIRRRKDGRDIHVSATVSPVRDHAGRVIGIAKVARDTTDRINAEKELAHAKDAAEAASRELEAFSYSVAHDLRAPLRGMNGFARLLLETYESALDAEGRDWLQEITKNAQRMGDLIDALLALARVTRSELRREPVDLSEIVSETAARLCAAERGRAVDFEVARNVRAEVDARLARVLFENLIGNAWKFTGRAVRSRIEFGVADGEGAPVFFIRDNGAGFDMAYVGKLFAPFQRLHAIGDFPGTGIGLATVQRIVHRHGGRIWAEAAVGAGATFYFTLTARDGGHA